MPQSTAQMSLPLIQGGQAQKHVTHNEALELLDIVVQLSVEDHGTTVPPVTATEGQSWLVGPAASGAWSGQSGRIASWRGGGWMFVTPGDGWRAWVKAAGEIRVYTGGTWQVTGGPGDLQNLDGVGINAAFDATNRLVVAADATLLNHDGAGHQLKLNKSGAGDTASLLYQTGFSGRAEIGLAGNDDLSVKTSADGAGFTEALRIDAATGMTQAACITGGALDLAPDTVGLVTPPALAGFVLVTVLRPAGNLHPLGSHAGCFVYDIGASPGVAIIGKGPQIASYGGASLTGASGVAGESGIACQTGAIQLLNRTSDTLTYNLTFLGGLPGR